MPLDIKKTVKIARVVNLLWIVLVNICLIIATVKFADMFRDMEMETVWFAKPAFIYAVCSLLTADILAVYLMFSGKELGWKKVLFLFVIEFLFVVLALGFLFYSNPLFDVIEQMG